MNEALNQTDVDSLLQRTKAGGKVTNDALTQREIDAILQKTSPGPMAPDAQSDVVPYNFSRPPRVSRDRRASLESICGTFAISLQALLSSLLRMPLDVVVGSIEQAMFSEYILSLGTPCASFVFDLGDRIGSQGAMDLSIDFAFNLVDRLFGGAGDPNFIQRPLTLLEQTVMRSVAERALGLLRDAWQDALALVPRVLSFESSPEMLQIASREDNVLVINLEVRSSMFNGFIALCLPMPALEPFLSDKTGGRGHIRYHDPDVAANRTLSEASLQHAHVGVVARFPTLWLSARQLADLVPGRILQTGVAADEPIDVHVNGQLRFMGALGQLRSQLGIRVTDCVQRPAAERQVQTRQGRVL